MTRQRILIIEDNVEIRETLRDVFELEGYAVQLAENGQEGLLAATQERDPPCLILLDLMMPVMDGWQFLQAIRTQGCEVLARVPVVVVSGVADHAAVSDLKDRFGCDVVRKPPDIDCLLALAHRYCCADDQATGTVAVPAH